MNHNRDCGCSMCEEYGGTRSFEFDRHVKPLGGQNKIAPGLAIKIDDCDQSITEPGLMPIEDTE